jgi:hypothetical protein
MELLCLAMASPFFEKQEPLQHMYSMLLNEQTIALPPRILL